MAVAGAGLLLACLGGCGPAPIESVSLVGRSLAAGLVAHWSFDDQGGTTVADRSGNGHDGQLTGGMWGAGRFGGGLRLQPGDFVTISPFPPGHPGLDGLGLDQADRRRRGGVHRGESRPAHQREGPDGRLGN
jgi:hypothetical protein